MRQRRSLTIADKMPFRAIFTAIGGIGARLRPPKTARTEQLSMATFDQSILSAKSQLVEQQLPNFFPHARLVPIAEPAPASHATTTAHLLWQIFPRASCPQHEQYARQRSPIRYRRSAALWFRFGKAVTMA